MSKFERWISAWIDVACGVVGILTFGCFRPNWDMEFVVWATIKNLKDK